MYVCMGKMGVRACEHTHVLRDRICFQPKTSSVCKVQIKNKEELGLQEPRPLPSLFCLFLFQTPTSQYGETFTAAPGSKAIA